MKINMSYCRFENTFKALKECSTELNDPDVYFCGLSEEERRYFLLLVERCKEVAENVDPAWLSQDCD